MLTESQAFQINICRQLSRQFYECPLWPSPSKTPDPIPTLNLYRTMQSGLVHVNVNLQVERCVAPKGKKKKMPPAYVPSNRCEIQRHAYFSNFLFLSCLPNSSVPCPCCRDHGWLPLLGYLSIRHAMAMQAAALFPHICPTV